MVREKVVRNQDGTVFCRTLAQVGPTLERDWVEGESLYPAADLIHEERAERGYWSRLMAAVRAWGLP